ncbi:ATP-binding cassette domain-containing protein [Acinetobacter baumannii]|uniref:methionine ABC transporter ATP-binding protein n=1 Tax=Acinetobacter baumannii TaxID=470 RepID=UPI0028108E0F|nr:ATP-binding cassette domain-containing protein [Acinetobacter baumannii]MDQ8919320.1 ATP-binding cassette domain-containing protein [Acinetobacter baumannii]MDQ8950273.1 ATP-binding cassette domain-containing protein [Acinetobacter baumannii]MDQ8964646.1 ATP-binding cassette domain-containing protein [Acinetobacter baumannii]MDQ8967982.1 ATP-binding cassette domain-containing protein [Acinetobacter baumannii]MDQ8982134.1 ATP-binding cassette domain-containing protein [Acinetobacter baumanni
MTKIAVNILNVEKEFKTKEGQFKAVNNVSMQVLDGDIYGVIGFSGAGKSTLLRMINLLEEPDQGDIKIFGQSLLDLSKKELLQQRKSIGMIFQHFNLLQNKTALENVELPLEFSRVSRKERRIIALDCLKIVDLADKKDAYPAKLSGGQKQRVAIARAISSQPKILLCDEPTSAVDPKTKQTILEYLKKINQQLGITIIIVTHEMQLIHEICNKVSVMENGEIVESFDLTNLNSIEPKSLISKILFNELKEGELEAKYA